MKPVHVASGLAAVGALAFVRRLPLAARVAAAGLGALGSYVLLELAHGKLNAWRTGQWLERLREEERRQLAEFVGQEVYHRLPEGKWPYSGRGPLWKAEDGSVVIRCKANGKRDALILELSHLSGDKQITCKEVEMSPGSRLFLCRGNTGAEPSMLKDLLSGKTVDIGKYRGVQIMEHELKDQLFIHLFDNPGAWYALPEGGDAPLRKESDAGGLQRLIIRCTSSGSSHTREIGIFVGSLDHLKGLCSSAPELGRGFGSFQLDKARALLRGKEVEGLKLAS
jgi:hypothetical protein